MNSNYRKLRIGDVLNPNDEIYLYEICEWIKIHEKFFGKMVNGAMLGRYNFRRPLPVSLGAIKPNTELDNENFKFVRDDNSLQQTHLSPIMRTRYIVPNMDTNKAKSDKKELNYHQIEPEAIRRLAFIFSEGAKKYGKDNYKKGFNDPEWINERYDHAIDHLLKWKSGDRSADHLAKVMWFAAVMIEFETANAKLNQQNAKEKSVIEEFETIPEPAC